MHKPGKQLPPTSTKQARCAFGRRITNCLRCMVSASFAYTQAFRVRQKFVGRIANPTYENG
jgi:hypothetical protein